MRRMRYSYFFVLVVIAGAMAVQYFFRQYSPQSRQSGPELATTVKPSYFRFDSNNRSRALAKRDGKTDRELAASARRALASLQNLADVKDQPQDAGEKKVKARHQRTLPESGASLGLETQGGECASVEIRGDGSETEVSQQDWDLVMRSFHEAKADLLHWLSVHRTEFPEKTGDIMEKQIQSLMIQRPPLSDEQDLNWRGIAVWSQYEGSEPLIRLGSGFIKLLKKYRERGRFEMSRLVAQAWAPCELARVGASAETWKPLLSCLGVEDERACGRSSYSEGGWAVSSTLAVAVAAPRCTVPAFRDERAASCLKKIPLPLTAARGNVDWSGRVLAAVAKGAIQ